ncbi:MAG: ZIP family metal transporter [Thermoplasmata archaeon]
MIALKKIQDNILSILLGASAGTIASISVLDLIPNTTDEGTFFRYAGDLLGTGIIGVLDVKFPHRHFSLSKDGIGRHGRYPKTGILLSIGIALHNLPEGVAIGASFMVSFQVGLPLTFSIVVHNFPEGIAVVVTMYVGGVKSTKIMLITALVDVPIGIGAFIGFKLGAVSPLAMSISLGFAAGAVLYIVFDELIPDALCKATRHIAIIGILFGILIGIMFIELLYYSDSMFKSASTYKL